MWYTNLIIFEQSKKNKPTPDLIYLEKGFSRVDEQVSIHFSYQTNVSDFQKNPEKIGFSEPIQDGTR